MLADEVVSLEVPASPSQDQVVALLSVLQASSVNVVLSKPERNSATSSKCSCRALLSEFQLRLNSPQGQPGKLLKEGATVAVSSMY